MIGSQLHKDGVEFRVWAPSAHRVEVVIQGGKSMELDSEANGYYSGRLPGVGAGTLYRYRLNGKDAYPDPCSRSQPEGPHGPSMIIDPNSYRWNDASWPGIKLHGQIFYELHVGTFTPEGTFRAIETQLAELKETGVTAIQLMPIAEFPGRWNWGYDGVCLYAPAHVYGTPDDLKHLVDTAHNIGIGVILDVVYNHLGPDGNYLGAYSKDYFTDRYTTDWGQAINYDGPNSGEVRRFFLQNACYWIEEFHLDGLRLDATQNIYDNGPEPILAELAARTRAAAGSRSIVLIAENEPQDTTLIRPPEQGGYGLDANWNDDFHHSLMVALTGRAEAYFTDYRGEPQEFVSLLKRGYLYQGQLYKWQKKYRGTPVTNEPGAALVFYSQNHDQVANSLHGERLHQVTSPGRYRAAAALLLLAPETPLLFMGQEFAASSPFLFFADHNEELRPKVHDGRREFLAQFPSYAAARQHVPDPSAESTFLRCKLDFSERTKHATHYQLHRDLIRLRKQDEVLREQDRKAIDGAVLGPHCFVIRYMSPRHGDRLLIVNLGPDFEYNPAPEPLLAPLPGTGWVIAWSSDHAKYGGPGAVPPLQDGVWRIPGESATYLISLS